MEGYVPGHILETELTWIAMIKLPKNKVRTIGVSNHTSAHVGRPMI